MPNFVKSSVMKEKRKKPVAVRIDSFVRHPIGKKTIFTIANTLTLTRVFFSPIFLLLYVEHDFFGISQTVLPYVLLLLLLALATSDAFDGYLARKFDQVTDLGKVLDPMADSIATMSVFLAFTQPPVCLPLIIVFLFIYRDSVISTLRTLCAMRQVTLAASSSGKIKTLLQDICAAIVTFLLIPYSTGQITMQTLHTVALYSSLVAAGYSLYSGLEYLINNFESVQKAIVRKEKMAKRERAERE